MMARRIFMDLEPEDHLLFKKMAFEANMSMKKFLTEIIKKAISVKKKGEKK